MRTGERRCLLAYKFHAAVLSFAVRSCVGRDRLGRAETCGRQPGCIDTELRHQDCLDGFSAPLGKIHVVLRNAGGVRVTVDFDLEVGVSLEAARDGLDYRGGFWFDAIAVGVE